MRDAEYKRMQCTMIEQQREIHQLKKELGIYKKFSLGKQITARDLDRILQKLLKKDQD